MTKAKSTMSTLLLSGLSLLLCISMLVGSTFAWFTDNAVSGSNVIKSGNLDIEVQYTLDGENWADLKGATDLFQKGLWEPGHTEVVALRIENKGSLALKYVANMNIFNETVGTNKDGEPIVLSEILTVSSMNMDGGPIGDVLAGTIFGADDAAIWDSTEVTTSIFKAGSILGQDQLLLPGASKYILIKVDMAETVGNEANHKGPGFEPSIEFGINVLATQYTYENDSFGNQYDKEATYDKSWDANADTSWYDANATEFTLTNANQLAGLAKLVNTGVDSFAGKTFVLGNNVDLNNAAWRPIGTKANPFNGTFNGNGKTVSNLLVETEGSYAGLFGYVGDGVSISNLTVENAVVKDSVVGDSTSCYGAVIGYCPGAVTLNNVNVEGDVAIYGDWYVGGLIGRAASAKITNCSVVGEDGSYVKSGSYVGGIIGYDNGGYTMSGCQVENLSIEATVYAGGLSGLGGVSYNKTVSPVISNNSVKDVAIAIGSAEAENALYYGTYIGCSNLYSYSKKPLVVYDNTYENVTCTVNGIAADVQELGAKYSDGTDRGLVIVPSLKVAGNGYHSFVKAAVTEAPKDGTEYVIELIGDTMFTANVKPTIAKGQNIVIKTNGYQVLFVESTEDGVLYNDDGTLKTTVVTAENMSSYITIKAGGTLVIE